MRVAFLYGSERTSWLPKISCGEAPDTLLWGSNHVSQFRIECQLFPEENTYSRELVARFKKLGKLGSHLLALRLLPNISKQEILFTSGAISLLLARTLLRLRKIKWIIFCLDLNNWLRRHYGWHRRIRAQILRQADAIVCVSRSQLEFFHNEMGFPSDKLHFIPFGSDITFFSPQNNPSRQSTYVLSVGRDLARDYATLIQAVRGLDIPIRIVASPRNLKGLSLPDNAEVLFDVPFVKLRELYAKAAFVVIPIYGDDYLYGSDCSGQTVLLDAMAMGKASIVSERPYLRDYILEGKTGIIVKPGNSQALREAIIRLWQNPDEAEQIGRRARQKAEEEFNTAVFAKRLADVFKSVVAT